MRTHRNANTLQLIHSILETFIIPLQIHFDETSWEKVRVDGSRKLKSNAVPTRLLPPSGVKRRDDVLLRKANANGVYMLAVCTNTTADNFTSAEPVPDESDPLLITDVDDLAGFGNPNYCLTETEDNSPTPDRNDLPITIDVDDSSESCTPTDDLRGTSSSPHSGVTDVYNLVTVTNQQQKKSIFGSRNTENHQMCNRLLEKNEKTNKLLMKRLNSLRAENQRLRLSKANIPKNVFNDDQIDMLERNLKKCSRWSNETIDKALRIKFSCGDIGYQELLKQNIPLPSMRTLSRKIEELNFDSGIQNDIFKLLEIKFSFVTNEHQRECVLVFDEININARTSCNEATKESSGEITPSAHNGDAAHALVIMLAGITSGWKQVVAYYYTRDPVQVQFLKPIILDITQRAEKSGLRVCNIVCDMGPNNQALWSLFGLQASEQNVKNFVVHPIHSDRKLYFTTDVPHLMRDLKSIFRNNKCIYLSESIQTKNDLPSSCIRAEYFNQVAESQNNIQILLSSKSEDEDFNSANTSSRLISDIEEKREFDTTAWFVNKISNWFTIMTSGHPSKALNKVNMDEYIEVIENLKEIIEIFETMQAGETNGWEPIKTGVIISTLSILQLSEYFLQDKQVSYLLTGKFTENCVENLFSVIRSKHSVPNRQQFKQHLRQICISQYMKYINNHNDD